MKMQKKYIIGISVLVLLCIILVIWHCLRPAGMDKDELKDSDYITGTSDKFEDAPDEFAEEDEVGESNSSDSAINDTNNNIKNETNSGAGSSNKNDNTTDSSGNNTPDTEQDKDNNVDTEDDKKDDSHEQDEGWSPFY